MTCTFPCAIKLLIMQHPKTKQKIICYTFDLEHDYAGLSPSEEYETFSHTGALDRLSEIVRRYEIKLTVFATGKVLDKKKETVDFFRGLGAEIELHGYHHIMYQPDLIHELHEGVEAYRKYFDRKPMGYRSPGCAISPALLKTLSAEGIQYDSSLIPSYRVGVYKNLKSPIKPFYNPEVPILELPVGVIPKIRLPIAASYIRLIGLTTYKLLFALFGTISPLVYLFHLVDLIPTQTRKQLSPFWRCVYAKSHKKGFKIFEDSVEHFKKLGYKPEYMSTLYDMYSRISNSQPENNQPVK